jgi:site-specific recombinase XerD
MGPGLPPPAAELALRRDLGSIDAVGRLDQHPVEVYLSRLGAGGSRETQVSCLRRVADLVVGEGGDRPWLRLDWGKLRYPHVRRILELLGAGGLGPATRRRYLSALKGVAKEAHRLGLMSAEACSHILAEQGPRGTRLPAGRVLEPLDLEQLYGACAANQVGLRDAALLAVLDGGGLRRAEAAGLSAGSFDVAQGTLRVVGKGDRERDVPLPPRCADAVRLWVSHRQVSSPWMFPHLAKGGSFIGTRPMTPQGVLVVLRTLATRAGIGTGFAAHDLRRTYITRLLTLGVDVVITQRLAGHADVSTTTLYDRRGDAEMRDAVKDLDVGPSDHWFRAARASG